MNMPTGAAPVSRDVVEIVKKKIAPPMGPPPSGMSNFKAPKPVPVQQYRNTQRHNDYDDDEQGDYDNYRRDSRDDRGRGGGGGSDAYDDNEDDDFDQYRSPKKGGGGGGGGQHVRRDSRDRDNDQYRGGGGGRGGRGDDRGYDDRRDTRYDNDRDRDRDRDRGYDDRGRGGGRDDDYYDQGRNNEGGGGDRRDDYRRDDEGGDRVEDRIFSRSRSRSDEEHDGGIRNNNQDSFYEAVREREGAAPNGAADSKWKTAGAGGATAAQMQLKAEESTKGPDGKGKLILYNFQPLLRATYRELRTFVSSPCPPGVTIRCYIERNRSGTNLLAPYYSICADLEDGTGRELMVCKKVLQSRSSHYVFSLKSEDLYRKREQRSRLYMGKLRAATPTEYVMYDNGICAGPDEDVSAGEEEDGAGEDGAQPKGRNPVTEKMERDRAAAKASGGGGNGVNDEVSLYRKELIVIAFNTKQRPSPPGVRGCEICIPKVKPALLEAAQAKEGPKPVVTPSSNAAEASMVRPFRKIRETGRQNELYASKLTILNERTSKYDPLSSCLVDFKGRASVASVKNAQFVESTSIYDIVGNGRSNAGELMQANDAEKDYCLQLGKTTEDCFNMDFRYPLSLLQAFAICIARFDAKLNFS